MKAKWIEVWQAIEATVALCVRDGKGGKSKVVCEWSCTNHPRHTILTWPSQASTKPPMVGLFVVVMDEPAPSRAIAVSAEVASGHGALQSAVPPTFAELENPEDLSVSLVEGSSPPMLPSRTDSVLVA